jgi:hypothetical protein
MDLYTCSVLAYTNGTQSNPNEGGLVIAFFLFAMLIGIGLSIGLGLFVRSAARGRGHDDSFCTMMMVLTFFLGPVIPLIIVFSTQGKGNKYTQIRHPGRPPLPPGARRPGPPMRRMPSSPQFAPQGVAPPPPPVVVAPAPPGFLNCPRCGQQNGVARDDCWSCGLGFHPSMKPPPAEDLEDLDYLPDDAAVIPQASVETVRQRSSPGEETVKQAPQVGEETVVKEQVATQPTERVIKVRCKDCRKKFSGRESIIEKLQTCPKCKGFPFQYEPAESP